MRILIVKLGAIGDVIQTAAAAKLLRDTHDVERIDWVCGKQCAPLLRHLAVADEVIEVDETILLTRNKRQHSYTIQVAISLAKYNRRNYHRIVVPQQDWRYLLLTSLIRSPKKLYFKRKSPTAALQLQRNRIYEAYRLLCDANKAILDLPAALKALGEAALSANKDLYERLPPSFVALCPGGAKNILHSDMLRRWPIDNYVQLAKLLTRSGCNVVLLGAPTDSWVSSHFSCLNVTDLTGTTNLIEMVQALSLADVVVTHDSGPLHMATLSDTGLVALFGPTPANAVIPFGRERTVVLRAENRVSCSPCYDGRAYADCNSPTCLEVISTDMVFKAIATVSRRT